MEQVGKVQGKIRDALYSKNPDQARFLKRGKEALTTHHVVIEPGFMASNYRGR